MEMITNKLKTMENKLTIEGFIEKWLVGYESLEQKLEFEIEIASDLASLQAKACGGHWVRVEDGLPEKEQEVTVYFRNEVGWHTTAAYWDGENFLIMCEVCGNRELFTHRTPVTHWMPLPNKPEPI